MGVITANIAKLPVENADIPCGRTNLLRQSVRQNGLHVFRVGISGGGGGCVQSNQ